MESKLNLGLHWEEIRAGNVKSLFDVYELLFDHLLNFGIRYSADVDLSRDLVNEMFMEIWDKKERLPAVENVKSYLLSYIKRKVIRHYYHDKLRRKAIDGQDIDIKELSYEDFIVHVQTEQDMRMRLKNALEKLTPAQSEIIQLKFFDNLNYVQIAELKSLTVKTAYNTIYDALKILRKEMNY
ncbi:RNA polymerase sigma factor [Pedobacter punctiformis]|uniref:Sigma-70 family RNA polymerase sigma factor n=1 Tax=Pedobacter punctiformis TaxID=3004097 RepID=A0ABT4L614_9SPHI|nr:sigma-70 family RNA polymerase sigma factor [Pedobacter sp. HCMS5-2]MCZ4242598.1 sigma-70 family RNA polymerase sigma factor [Pedobacter sp. HCMS5-2]